MPEPLELRTAKGQTFELSLEGVYDNLGIVTLELKGEDGAVRVLELEITTFRGARMKAGGKDGL